MPPIQTVYSDNIAEAVEGMVANLEFANLISREVETAAIGFGKVVKQGAADNGVVAASAAADVVRGLTVRDHSARIVTGGNADEFAVGETALIMTKGVIWVTSAAACTAGGPVYMDVATGKFTSTATANLPVPNAVFDSSAAGVNELVKVRLN